MAALNLADMAGPLAPDDPCGPDLDGDPDFMNVTARLEVALPTSYFRRDDEGRQVAFDRSTIDFAAAFADIGKLLARSRDLRLFVLAGKLSLLNRDIAAFASCLSIIARNLAEHWDKVHPRPEEGDLILREVVLQGLDELPTIVLPLQHAPLLTSRRIGPLAFRSHLVAIGDTRLVEGEEHPDAGSIQAALGEADLGDLTATLAHFTAMGEALAQIRTIWIEKAGVDQAVSFPRLSGLVDQIIAFLDAAVVRRAPERKSVASHGGAEMAVVAVAGDVAAPLDPASACTAIPQVKDALAACLDYFRRAEPSSPAVLLISQAQQLIGKSLIEVMQIMFPAHFDKAVIELGSTLKFQLSLERLVQLDGGSDEAGQESGEAGSEDEIAPTLATVGTRAEAISRMKAVAAFYRQAEPSNPIPLLMDKACGLAQHDFLSLLGDILPEVGIRAEGES